jgi:CRISPR-associated protein Csb1
MWEKLEGANRVLMEVDLKPVQGDRFQPTGFADLGAAMYERPDGKRMLLVESAQSMANRLEHTCLQGNGPHIAPMLKGLPYVVAQLTGGSTAETSSLVEAHRINSPYIISDAHFQKAFSKMAGYEKGKVLDWGAVAKTLLHYDPNSLIHGVFMANLGDGRVKVPRILTGFIEAEGVREAPSGGVKNNPLDPSGKLRAVAEPKNVYGNVPYHRTEYTASRITASFNLDFAAMQGYQLPAEGMDLLVGLSLYKVRRFVQGSMRLRTACDLVPKGEIRVTGPPDFSLPTTEKLLETVQKSIQACTEKGLFAKPAVTIIKCETKVKKEGENEADNGEGVSEQSEEQ